MFMRLKAAGIAKKVGDDLWVFVCVSRGKRLPGRVIGTYRTLKLRVVAQWR
jgi:hypothetical protein